MVLFYFADRFNTKKTLSRIGYAHGFDNYLNEKGQNNIQFEVDLKAA
jgi:hypothetical protein